MRVFVAGFANLCPLLPVLALLGCGSASSDDSVDTAGGASNTGGSAMSSAGTASGGTATSGGTSSSGGAAGSSTGGASTGGSTTGGGAGTAGSSNGGTGPEPTVGDCDDLGGVGEWEDIRPDGIETTQALALDPFNIGTLWFGTHGDGLMKSTDCGSSWVHINTGTNGTDVDKGSIWSMAFDPVNEGIVYVVGAYGAQGLFKSTNGGVDWAQLFSAESEFAQTVPYTFVGSITMDPHDPLHLAVGTHSDCLGDYAPACMAESTDGGTSWSLYKTPFLPGWAEQTGPYLIDATRLVYATLDQGLWFSDNNGADWLDVTPSGVNGATGGEYTTEPITTGPDGTLYLPSISEGGLLKSTNDGASWERLDGAPNGSFLLGITIGGGKIYLGDEFGHNISVASLDALSSWEPVPTLPEGNKPPFLRYDEAHHILYSAGAGLVRMVTE